MTRGPSPSCRPALYLSPPLQLQQQCHHHHQQSVVLLLHRPQAGSALSQSHIFTHTASRTGRHLSPHHSRVTPRPCAASHGPLGQQREGAGIMVILEPAATFPSPEAQLGRTIITSIVAICLRKTHWRGCVT